MARLSSCLFLVLLFLAAAKGGLCQAGEPKQCIISWDCQGNTACKVECRTNYRRGRGFCTGSPRACLCAYLCPP
ncbi:hypothetical protein MANES_13G037100v8 [Manihot esculenta]|uniref:Knottin scorpion toxin-like domain-containing protein n=1 Tax=Manihot esculenta TaxID=3983 RepID=A0A2C9UPP5_MANES|nr:hypothetical protein MANES_13G037100v8 [Manihot esculenta]